MQRHMFPLPRESKCSGCVRNWLMSGNYWASAGPAPTLDARRILLRHHHLHVGVAVTTHIVACPKTYIRALRRTNAL
ncbi:hypothetical protein EJ05DRAFT_474056 [Pseudovirgaria hyperparasitica]|uniref:Uncharacterized protein n=1 Tax=Pseudovirgaria hyperparasitica TaxID=470096 RepID=A0A6A6WBT3_9PEZI|nr:uncharacterized protein EJ05DRAFT_474056 [Pseudovirgaria hyperparasitica]KAF2760153.1 hypothetical protein EJ05DRAFT_474056 [Pseudovirgaria hyperparasitica]